jgi:hypothetical protein
VATDDPPTAGQLGNAKAAAGDASTSAAQITVPVAQFPVAVLLSLPTGCTLEPRQPFSLYNQLLSNVFQGTNARSGSDASSGGVPAVGGYALGSWGALLEGDGYTPETASNPPTAPGQFFDAGGAAGCSQAITGQVAANVSGESFAFKSYEAQIDANVWAPYASDYAAWPSSAVVQGEPLSPGATGSGSVVSNSPTALAKNAAATPGSIGYADAIHAAQGSGGAFTNKVTVSTHGNGPIGHAGTSPAHDIVWAQIQNDGLTPLGPRLPAAQTADPLSSDAVPESEPANCQTSTLQAGETPPPPAFDSWAGALASNPDIAATNPGAYPVCALTYDLAWGRYGYANLAQAYGANNLDIGLTVKDLITYITGTAAQAAINSRDYAPIPQLSSFLNQVRTDANDIGS